MFAKLINYLKGVKAELKNVNWPSKNKIINSTLLVIGFSLAVSILLGLFDVLFAYLLNKFVL